MVECRCLPPGCCRGGLAIKVALGNLASYSRWAKLGGKRALTEEMRVVLVWICEHLKVAGPRVIRKRTPELMPVLVFTDGAFEPEATFFRGCSSRQ